MARIKRAYGIGRPFRDVFPVPVIAARAPLTSDTNYEDGQVWIRTSTNQVWIKTSTVSGSATWSLAGPGASDVDTINSLSPVAGNIIIDGGTNITDVNAGNTVTLNLDAAITLATSVTSPIYTSAAAADTNINSAAGQNIILQMGDAAAANKVSFETNASAEVASLDSAGTLTVVNMDGIIGATTPAAGTFTTVTANTSVTSALYTSAAGADCDITAPVGQNMVLKLGDAAGANKLSVTDSADVEVFAVDSNGGQTYTSITSTGLITGQAGITVNSAGTAITLGGDNSGDAVILGGGTTARAITIGQDAAAHTVAIGQAAAGAITVDTAAGISLDSATASNFTVTGAADLTLDSSAGSVNIAGGEAAVDAVSIQAAAGGIDVNGALEINIDSSEAAVADAVRIVASAADGGIDIDSGTGGLTLDSTGAISIDAAAASNFSVSGAGIDLTLGSAAGRVIVNGEEAATDAITLLTAAGGIDVNAALEINIDSSEAAVADAVRIVASAADGGIDIDAGTGGITIDSTGALSLDGAAASNFSVSGAGIDLTLASAAGRVVVNGEEAAADAIRLLSAAGGLDTDVALQMNLVSSQAAADAIVINASGGGVDITAATNDLDIAASTASVNITAAEAVGDAIVINASNAAGGVDIQAGTGGVNIASGQIVNVVSKTNADTPYALLGTDYVVAGDTGAGVLQVTLPAAPATGRVVIVTDEGGAAGASNITVNGNGKNIASAGAVAATAVINSNYGSMYLIYTGTIWNAFDLP